MSGIEFLEEAMDIYPLARRVLLTAYADTHAAIDAINVVDLDHYLLKPWDPPEEKLYPVIDGLLEAWHATGDRAIPHTKVIGHRWNERSWEVRQFLARNQHSFRSFMADEPKGKQLLDAAGLDGYQLPVVITEQGETLVEPTERRTGRHARAVDQPVAGDVRARGHRRRARRPGRRRVRRVRGPQDRADREAPRPVGRPAAARKIENYLGFPTGVSGAELTTSARRQAERFGAEVITTRKAVRLHAGDSGTARTIEFEDGSDVGAQAVILATGVDYRELQVNGCWNDPDNPACNYVGRGVFYGASVSDSSECKGEDVYIVGGANSAGQAAMFMSRTAKSVTLLVRGPSLEASMSYYLIRQIEKNDNITVRTCTEVVDTLGEDDHLTGLVLFDKQSGEKETVSCDRLCCFIGAAPRTDWLDVVAKDDHGFILSGPDLKDVSGWTLDRPPHHLETSVPGVFVAGDVRAESAKRVAAAVGEGSMAVMLVHRYLAEA